MVERHCGDNDCADNNDWQQGGGHLTSSLLCSLFASTGSHYKQPLAKIMLDGLSTCEAALRALHPSRMYLKSVRQPKPLLNADLGYHKLAIRRGPCSAAIYASELRRLRRELWGLELCKTASSTLLKGCGSGSFQAFATFIVSLSCLGEHSEITFCAAVRKPRMSSCSCIPESRERPLRS